MSWLAGVGVVVVVLAVVFVVAAYLWRWEWAGFAADPESGRPSKTLWDWLQLFVIPLGLAAVAFALNAAQSNREQKRADQRAGVDRQIAADRRQEDALSAYLQQMSDLMLQRDLLSSERKPAVVAVARTLTLSVLPRLDAPRKSVVLRFLAEGGLLKPVRKVGLDYKVGLVNMDGADLRGVAITNGRLEEADLSHSDLRGADFTGTELVNVSMSDADVRGANFSEGFQYASDFQNANLTGADFHHSLLRDVQMGGATLRGANFTDVDFSTESVRQIDFSGSDLSEASFRNASVKGNFGGAKLMDADFSRSIVAASSFSDSCISGARFFEALLKASDLGSARGHDVDFSHAHFQQVDLRKTSLADIDLTKATFDRASHRPDANRTEDGRCQ